FTDPAGNDPVSSYAARIIWGDGAITNGTVRFVGGTYRVTGSHEYLEGGRYTLAVSVSKLGGAPSAASTFVDVQDLPITAVPIGSSAQEGSSFSGHVARFTDADPDPQFATNYSATVDWGDNTTTAGTIVINPAGGFFVDGTHAYAAFGNYPVSVKVTGI